MERAAPVLLIDTSGWSRLTHPAVFPAFETAAEENRVATTQPARLEILYAARSARDYSRIAQQLDAMRQIPCDGRAMDRALDVQRQLAAQGALHHRSVRLPDLLIAAAAEIGGATVWHYDSDYDRIAKLTGQPTEWIAPRGSL